MVGDFQSFRSKYLGMGDIGTILNPIKCSVLVGGVTFYRRGFYLESEV